MGVRQVRTLILALSLVLADAGHAVASSAENEPGENSLLSRLSVLIRASAQSDYDFQQTRTLSILARPVQSSGVLHYRPELGMCWIVLHPFYSKLRIDDKGISELLADGVERKLLPGGNPVFDVFAQVYQAIFQGDLSHLDESFNLQPKLLPGGSQWQLRLLPKPAAGIDWLSVISLSGDGYQSQMHLLEQSGDSTQFNFKPRSDTTMDDTCW